MLLSLEEATRGGVTLILKNLTHPYGITQAILGFDVLLWKKFSVLKLISYFTNESKNLEAGNLVNSLFIIQVKRTR